MVEVTALSQVVELGVNSLLGQPGFDSGGFLELILNTLINSIIKSGDRWENSRFQNSEVITNFLDVSGEETAFNTVSQGESEHGLLEGVRCRQVGHVAIIFGHLGLDPVLNSIGGTEDHLVREHDTLGITSSSRSVREHIDILLVGLVDSGSLSIFLELDTLGDQGVPVEESQAGLLSQLGILGRDLVLEHD